MNERERVDFEHHKKAAEEQLNKMYYGTGGRTTNKGGLPMPSFIAAPPRQNGNEKNTKNADPKPKAEGGNQNKKAESGHEKPQKISPKNGYNILNLLNFKGLKMDNDRLVILAVCLLLAGEETDELLMLALIYIML